MSSIKPCSGIVSARHFSFIFDFGLVWLAPDGKALVATKLARTFGYLAPDYAVTGREDDRETPSFIFESVDPGFRESSVGRYSVIGAQPVMEVVSKENKVTIFDHDAGRAVEKIVEDPMMIPRSISEGWRPQLIQGLPAAFCD